MRRGGSDVLLAVMAVAGLAAAEKQFRRMSGYRDLAKLVIAIKRHALLIAPPTHDRKEVAELTIV